MSPDTFTFIASIGLCIWLLFRIPNALRAILEVLKRYLQKQRKVSQRDFILKNPAWHENHITVLPNGSNIHDNVKEALMGYVRMLLEQEGPDAPVSKEDLLRAFRDYHGHTNLNQGILRTPYAVVIDNGVSENLVFIIGVSEENH